jgi:glycosyltransferase involved in cell wall biosynthesis
MGVGVLPRLALSELRLLRTDVTDRDVLLVGYPGQLDMWAARRHQLPVAFNAMVSLYDTFVGDRGRFRERSLPARALLNIDRRAFHAADALVADTAANAQYMADLAGLTRVEHVYVGAEERIFQHSWRQPSTFSVTFVGKLIPLHGLDLILDAARRLEEIPFVIIGDGQQRALLDDIPPNVKHIPWVGYEELASIYASSGVALGVFGDSAKTDRVIPNKAYQALAVGAPLITADTLAVRELLTNERDALLVERSGEALAAGITRLAEDRELAVNIAAAGRRTFERECSEHILGERWSRILEQLT